MENPYNYFENFTIEEYEEFMKGLINGYFLEVNSTRYSFEEIELYYYSEKAHKDSSVFKRDKKAGEFFFHGYGFDICFGTKDNPEVYGGVLIRTLLKHGEAGGLIHGPFNCLIEVLRVIEKGSLSFSLVKKESPETLCVVAAKRKQGSKSHDYSDKEYRFFTWRSKMNSNVHSREYWKVTDGCEKDFHCYEVIRPLVNS